VRDEAERFIARMLGVELRREHYDRGAAFCRGVVERAGTDALHGVFARLDRLPTPSELEAPGLYLARLEISEQPPPPPDPPDPPPGPDAGPGAG
jgi:uncharacterized protein (DUF2342 family)